VFESSNNNTVVDSYRNCYGMRLEVTDTTKVKFRSAELGTVQPPMWA